MVRIIIVLSVVVAGILITACSSSDTASTESPETPPTTAPKTESTPPAAPIRQPTAVPATPTAATTAVAPTVAPAPTTAPVPTATTEPSDNLSTEDYGIGVDELAPLFQLPGARGEEYTLEQYRGEKNVVLVFYRAFW